MARTEHVGSDGLTNSERNCASRPLPVNVEHVSYHAGMIHYRMAHHPQRPNLSTMLRRDNAVQRIGAGKWTTSEMITLGITPAMINERRDQRETA